MHSKVKEFADLIHQYAQAAVNLYGVISQEELVEIFNAQNEQQTDIDIRQTKDIHLTKF